MVLGSYNVALASLELVTQNKQNSLELKESCLPLSLDLARIKGVCHLT